MTLKERIETGKMLILDGATGSQLIANGLKYGQSPEMWNITHPDIVRDIAAYYFEAGAEAVLTNTFGGSPVRMNAYHVPIKAYEINYQGAKLAISVRPEGKFVLGSIGPSKEMLEPFGKITTQVMKDSYAVQVMALHKAGVDGFILETFSDLQELLCAVKAVKRNSDLPFFVAMTFLSTAEGFKTRRGVSVSEFIEEMEYQGALVIGANCGSGIMKMTEVAAEFRNVSESINLLLKANAGEPQFVNGKPCYVESPELFAKNLPALLKHRPAAIGGCCGTTPEHIRLISKSVAESYVKSHWNL
jgi:5-methyltetrahydrofolate--homocysteine methyltransferase